MNIEEFAQKLSIMETEFPADASDSLAKATKRMVRGIKKSTPNSRVEHKHKLQKSWESEIKDPFRGAPYAEIRSKAPHFHLVNRGVQNPKDAHGNPKPELRDALNKHVGYLEKAVRKNWPDVKDEMQKDFYKKVKSHLR